MHNKFLEKYYFIDKFKKSNIDKQDLNTTIIYRNYKKNYKIDEILCTGIIPYNRPKIVFMNFY